MNAIAFLNYDDAAGGARLARPKAFGFERGDGAARATNGTVAHAETRVARRHDHARLSGRRTTSA